MPGSPSVWIMLRCVACLDTGVTHLLPVVNQRIIVQHTVNTVDNWNSHRKAALDV